MNAGDIAFPNLGIYLKDVPKSFSVFGFDIAFYGLIIGIGVLAGLLMAVHMAESGGLLGLLHLCSDLFYHRGQNLLRDLCVGFL